MDGDAHPQPVGLDERKDFLVGDGLHVADDQELLAVLPELGDEVVRQRWESEKAHLTPLDNRPPYPYANDEARRVSRDAYVAWRGSRYSVPWQHAGAEVWLRTIEGRLEVRHGEQRIAVHALAEHRHMTIRTAAHHAATPLNATPPASKNRIVVRVLAPEVEVRSLASYDAIAGGAL